MMNATNISTPAPTPAPAPSSSSPMTTTTNLLSNALSIACEIPVEEANIMSFLDLREFLMTACTVVVLLTTLNALQGTLLKAFKRIQRIVSNSKNKYKVLPTNNKKEEKRKETEQTENTAKDKDDDDNAKEDDDHMKTKLKKTLNEKINEMMENTNTFFDDKKDEIKEQHSLGQIDIILHIAQALCTIYSAVSYWNTYIPDLNGKDARVQILCRAAHLTILPLFKPISISMWPALMPLIQFLHWNLLKNKDMINYSDRVLPGTQPFELNWLSFIYVYVVGFCWMVYMVGTIIFWPLVFLSSWILIPVIFVIPFLLLHLPVQIINGRMFCCRCCLCCWKKSDIKKLKKITEWYGVVLDEPTNIAKHFNIKENENLDDYVRDSNAEKDEGIELLTLKALTVLYLVLSVASLYFLPIYYGKSNMYDELVKSFTMELNFIPVIEFMTINLDFQFIFEWPDELNFDFQVVLFFSIGLIIFERLIAILLFIDEHILGDIEIDSKWFERPMYVVYIPYKVGEIYYVCFEIGWECLVLLYVMVVGVPCGFMYKCFERCGKYPFGEIKKKEDPFGNLFLEIPGQILGFKLGFLDAIGKTGLYTFIKRCIRDEDLATDIGSGLTSNIVSMWMLNNNATLGAELDLSNYHLGNEGTIGLCKVLKMNNTVKELKLENNNITDIQSIGDALKTNNTLTTLWLDNNNITDVQSIGEGLKTNNTLKTLNLRDNNITDVQSIGELLKTNTTLEELALNDNNITNVQSIGEGLKTNNTLETLELQANNITDDGGIQSIIDVLKTNNTLRYLYLHNNPLSDNMKSQLRRIQQYKIDGSNGYQQVKGMSITA